MLSGRQGAKTAADNASALLQAAGIRDPDRNVIKLDACDGEKALTHSESGENVAEGFLAHP